MAKHTTTREFRQNFVAGFKASGLTKEAYCRQNGYSPRTLNRWIAEFAEGIKKGSFVRVTATRKELEEYFCSSKIETGKIYQVELTSTHRDGLIYSLAGAGPASWVKESFVELVILRNLKEGDWLKVTANAAELDDFNCTGVVRGGIYQIERVNEGGFSQPKTSSIGTFLLSTGEATWSNTWVRPDMVELVSVLEVPEQPVEEPVEAVKVPEVGLLPVGSKVIVTAPDDRLRRFSCNREIETGKVFTIVEVDSRDDTYRLSVEVAPWVSADMVEAYEEPEEPAEERAIRAFVKIVGTEEDLRTQEVHRSIVAGGTYEVNFVDSMDGNLNLKTEPQYSTTNVSPDIVEYVDEPVKSLRDVKVGDSLLVTATEEELREFSCNEAIKTGQIYKVAEINEECGFEDASETQGTFKLDVGCWDSWVRPEMVQIA